MIWAIIIGFFVGTVAKFLMPGRDPGGFVITILLGIGGAIFANWIGANLGIYHDGEVAGLIAAIIGSMLLLVIYRMIAGRGKALRSF